MTSRMRTGCRAALWLLIATQAIMAAGASADSQWTWELSKARFQRLDPFERAQYQKAADLFRRENYRAACSEFEKMKMQFPDSEALPYAVFMHARSLHEAKHRNEAVKAYNELLDYFADEVWVAAPALYYLGMAHLDNGDVRKAMEIMQEIADDEEYAGHAIAAGAFRLLGDNHWKNKEPEKAVACWRKAAALWAINRDQASIARAKAVRYYLGKGDMAGYEAWRLNEENRDDAGHRRYVAADAANEAVNVYTVDSEFYAGTGQDALKKDMAAFFTWYKAQKPWFQKDDEPWTYYSKGLYFLGSRFRDRKEMESLADETIAYLKELNDAARMNERLAWTADRLKEGGHLMRARHVLAQMTDPSHAAYKEHELLCWEKKWPEAASRLVDVEKMGDEAWARRAKGSRAWIYKDRLGKFDEAVKLYQELDDPPGTLWRIQECHRRAGRLDKAMITLNEIENMFPDDAPNAAWHKAWYWHEAREKKKAIAEARKILKKYKESRAASSAHQLLEEYGVETGGGVFEQD